MAVPHTQPIVSPTHYDPSFKVDIQLQQPLHSRKLTLGDIRLEVMSLCFQLETLCTKEQGEQSCIQNGHVSNSFMDRATMVHNKILQKLNLSSNISPGNQDILTYLQSQSLDRLFPRTLAYLANPTSFSLDLDKTSLDNYFASISNLSQMSTLARQLHNDCSNPCSHKYIAHQLALLYQTVTQIKCSIFAEHKKSIEMMFKPIKATLAATSGDQHHGCLTAEQQEWLLNLTSHILNVVSKFPVELTQDLIQPAAILLQKI